MKQTKKNEELQSRREFFKKAAKGALPILGLVALTNVPLLSQATEVMGCGGSCRTQCTGYCQNTCNASCYHGCRSGCGTTCKGVNK